MTRSTVFRLALFSCLLLGGRIALAGDHEAKADPPAVDVIEKHIQAVGGRELLSSVKTMVQHGTISGDLNLQVSGWITDQSNSQRAGSGSRPMPHARKAGDLQVFQKVPRLFADVVQVDGKLWYDVGVYRKGDSDFYWIYIPTVWTGDIKLDKDKYQAKSLFDPLLRWKDYFKVIQYDGDKTFEGQSCIALKFYPEDGSMPYTRYYDPKTWMLLGEGNTRFKRVYSDYRDVSGAKMAFGIHYENNGNTYDVKFDRTSFNDKIEDSFFNPDARK